MAPIKIIILYYSIIILHSYGTTVIYAVLHWPKSCYAVHDYTHFSMCKTWGVHSGAAVDSGLHGCDAVSMGECLMVSWRLRKVLRNTDPVTQYYISAELDNFLFWCLFTELPPPSSNVHISLPSPIKFWNSVQI